MKVLFVICFVVVICMIIANIIWDIALTERERKCKVDLLDLSKKWDELQAKEDCQQLVSHVQEETKNKLDALDKVLQKKDQKLNEKAALLDARAKELKDYAEILDGVQASLAEREAELTNKKADVSTREAILHFMGVPDAPDIIEPIDVPAAMKELDEKIELVKQHGSLKNADKYLDEMRGREPAKPIKKVKKGGKK